MAKKDKRPNQSDPALIGIFSQFVTPGQYVLFGSSDVPEGIPWGGDECRAVVLAASTVGLTSADGPVDPGDPYGDLYLLRYFRIYPDSPTPRKADDALYWNDVQGNCWSIHSKDSPDHHSSIMSSTDLEALIDDLDLPSARRGTLDEYREAGGFLYFESAFRTE